MSLSPQTRLRWFAASIWLLRIVVGAVFVMSGLVKMLDPWGFVYKIEEYLWVWHIHQPRTIEVCAAMLIAGYEFVLGMLLALGCYKRIAPWLLLAQMAVMLPLTFYIWIADPVDDCGCFGDFIILSNGATFAKNVAITAALILLSIYNKKLKQSLFTPAIQWLVGAWVTLYIILVGLYGYNVQPMVDFRPYPIGTRLADNADEAHGDEAYGFIYEKAGVVRTFSLDNLPDSTWHYVDRLEPTQADNVAASLEIYNEDAEEVTEEVILSHGRQLLLVIPEIARADIAYSYPINEIHEHADSLGIPMIALIGAGAEAIERWRDMAMAEYPCYTVEDTKLKELVRGNIALVLLYNGVIENKTSLKSLNPTIIESPTNDEAFIGELGNYGRYYFITANLALVGGLIVICLFQGLILAIRHSIRSAFRRHPSPN